METPRCEWCGASWYTMTLFEWEVNGEKVIACKECMDYQNNKYVAY